MAEGQKRTERIGVNVTPAQHQHLQAIAVEADTNPSSYVYELICQSLSADPSMSRTEVSNEPEREEQLGELYGILDGLKDKLEHQAEQIDPDLLHKLSGQIESVQETLHSLHRLQAK